jgi:hypothetical protein
LATGKDFIPLIRRPVANIIMPPKEVKSAIKAGVVIGNINVAPKNKASNIMICGIKINPTKYPRLVAKIPALYFTIPKKIQLLYFHSYPYLFLFIKRFTSISM